MALSSDIAPVLAGRRILVTGNTGFTGGWASLWLQEIGAEVVGYSLPPETTPSLFAALGLDSGSRTVFGDICNFGDLFEAVSKHEPELILHLAAQPLVRRSYREPVRTFSVNAQGTAHVLEVARQVKSVAGVVCVTTDKVYRNHEWPWPYRENDALGGKDPYSASKAAAELTIESYMRSFPWQTGQGPRIAVARGGNIIGGGDWSEDRLIPDYVRAVVGGGTLTLRYPDAIRPWQHVLALVQGYAMLLAGLVSDAPETYARAWNLGPLDPDPYSVRDVLEAMGRHWQRPNIQYLDNPAPEAGTLALDSSLARNVLGWRPPWDTLRAITETANWYRGYYANPAAALDLTLGQIRAWRAELGG
jgi:CDP-glucose 4,6-dehydratase